MGERMFVIKEVTDRFLLYEDSLQLTRESELRRRLTVIRARAVEAEASGANDEDIQILLHGEGKEQPIPRPGEWPDVPLPAGKLISRAEALKFCKETLERAEAERLPKPEPTTETHEAWIERMPRQMLYTEWYEWADALCEWLLEEPEEWAPIKTNSS